LVLASNRPDCEDIKRSTAGVLFLGTPHEGTDVAGYGSFIAKLKGNDPSLIQSLKPTDEDLYALSLDFAAGYRHLNISCFYEKLDNAYVGGLAKIKVSMLPKCQSRLYGKTDGCAAISSTGGKQYDLSAYRSLGTKQVLWR